MSGITKGPWKQRYSVDSIFNGHTRWFLVTAPKKGEIGRFKKEADAVLAAAAPELFEALQSCISQIKALCSADDVPDQAISAIAKATTPNPPPCR